MDIIKTNTCTECNSEIKYCNKYDSYYCESCNTWLESLCEEPDCEYCRHRPETPSQVYNNGK